MPVPDKFQGDDGVLGAPALDAFAVTPSASDLPTTAQGLYVGTTGDVTVTTKNGTSVTFKNVPAGSILPVRCVKVTAGSDIVAFS